MIIKNILSKILGTSWKTSLGGWGLLFTSLGTACTALTDGDPSTMPDLEALIAGFAGVSLLFSRDNGVTSEDAGVK